MVFEMGIWLFLLLAPYPNPQLQPPINFFVKREPQTFFRVLPLQGLRSVFYKNGRP
jgi:hypothetical protein